MASVPPVMMSPEKMRLLVEEELRNDPGNFNMSPEDAEGYKLLNQELEAIRRRKAAEAIGRMPSGPFSGAVAAVSPETYENMAYTDVGGEQGNAANAFNSLIDSLMGGVGGVGAASPILRTQESFAPVAPKANKSRPKAPLPLDTDFVFEPVRARAMRHKDTPEAMRAKYGKGYGKTKEVTPITPEQKAEIASREQADAAARSRAMMARNKKSVDVEAELAKMREASEKGYDEGLWSIDKTALNRDARIEDADFVADSPTAREFTQDANAALVRGTQEPTEGAYQGPNRRVQQTEGAPQRRASDRASATQPELVEALRGAMGKVSRKFDPTKSRDFSEVPTPRLKKYAEQIEAEIGKAYEDALSRGAISEGATKTELKASAKNSPAVARYLELLDAKTAVNAEWMKREE